MLLQRKTHTYIFVTFSYTNVEYLSNIVEGFNNMFNNISLLYKENTSNYTLYFKIWF